MAAVLASCVGGATTQKPRRPCRFLIPKDYVGWLKINFKAPDATALSLEDGLYLFRFAPDGTAKTSSDIEYGARRDEYYYYSATDREPLDVTGWGKGGVIWVIKGVRPTILRFWQS